MAAVDWQEVIDACDQAILDIAETQRPVTVTYAGRTVQLFTAAQALTIKAHAEGQLQKQTTGGDPTSFAESHGLV